MILENFRKKNHIGVSTREKTSYKFQPQIKKRNHTCSSLIVMKLSTETVMHAMCESLLQGDVNLWPSILFVATVSLYAIREKN